MIEDYDEEKQSKKKYKLNIYNLDFKIEVNNKKVKSILEKSGITDAYYYLINNIKQTGWPKKDLYDYSSVIIKRYEDGWKKRQIQKRNEKIEKYLEDKKKLYSQDKIKGDNNKKIFKIINEREANKFIQRLDKSRSSLHIIDKTLTMSDNLGKNNDSNEQKSKQKYKKINLRYNNSKNKSRIYNNFNYNLIKSKSKYNNNEKLYFKISLNNKNDSITNLENDIDQTLNKNKNNLYKSYDINIDNNLDIRKININNVLKNK